MHYKIAFILLGLISSTAVAQPAKHPQAEKALARIVLEKDFGDDLKFDSREVISVDRNS